MGSGIVGVLMGLLVAAGVVGLVIVVAIVAGLVYGIRRAGYALKGEPYKPLLGSKKERPYQHQDLDEGATAESIANVLRNYSRVDVVGRYAKAGLGALEDEERKTSSFTAILNSKFSPSSLSWGKFAVAADATHEAILKNCASLANRVQVFDHEEFRRVESTRRSISYRTGEKSDPTLAEKRRLFQTSLSEMDAILLSNDRLLLELDKLTAEIGKINDAETTENSDRIVEEIRKLAEETKYYN
ncbi:MAG: hypothetical protein IJ087_09625 [Eggerthellaceae bacterium]|nr:hypothetical protein [Eggerthellaceae bacterium]